MAITASPQDQVQLLAVQDVDTKLLQLAHKRASIVEVARAHELEVLLGSIDLKIVAVDTEISDLELAVRKAELDVEQVHTRAARDKERMDSGAVGAKDLESLAHELESLARRQAELEEVELEVMQTLEEALAAKEALIEQKTEVETEYSQVKASADSQLAEIDSQVDVLKADRAHKVSNISAELVGLYDKICADFGGFGAAEFTHNECQGCHITLDANEIANINKTPVDQVIRCQECRRILVRS